MKAIEKFNRSETMEFASKMNSRAARQASWLCEHFAGIKSKEKVNVIKFIMTYEKANK